MFKKLSPVLFIVLVNTVFTRSSGSVPVYDVSGKKSLYPPDGKVAVLDADDMQTVFNSDKASLVVFYADWCHWSKELVPVYEQLANETYDMRQMCVVASFNCAADDSDGNVCRKLGITGFPTLRYFGPHCANATNENGTYVNPGETVGHGDPGEMKQELMELIEESKSGSLVLKSSALVVYFLTGICIFRSVL